MDRINVIGTSCSGKTTLARALGARLGLPVTELDAAFWGPDWTPVPREAFRSRIAAAAAGERWVLDGSYSRERDLTWARAELVVWLDYPLPTVLRRWARRTVVRLRDRREFWPGTGNTESFRRVMARDSLLWWILRTHRGRRRRTLEHLSAHPGLRVVRLRSPRQASRWLASVEPGARIPSRTAGAIASAQKP